MQGACLRDSDCLLCLFPPVLSPASVRLLMANSLPNGATVGEIAAPFAEGITPGAGFGLGGYVSVSFHPSATRSNSHVAT